MGLRWPRRGVGKRTGGLIIGGCFFMAGGLGLEGLVPVRAPSVLVQVVR